MKWKYTVSTNTIWASFDYGEVEADSSEEAFELAKEELQQNFDKANRAFNHSTNGEALGFRIEFDADQIQIEPLKQ